MRVGDWAAPTPLDKERISMAFTHDFRIDFNSVLFMEGDCEIDTDGIASYKFTSQSTDGLTIPQSSALNNLLNSITHFYKEFPSSGELTFVRLRKKTV